MAWGRKKGGGRKEPQFGLGGSLAELRLGPRDRVAPAEEEKPKKRIPKPKVIDEDDDDDDAPRERKPRTSRASRKRKSTGRTRGGLLRLVHLGGGGGPGDA